MTDADRAREQLAALRALAAERLARAWPRLGLALALLHAAVQGAGAMVLRAADGSHFFAEGIVAKSLGVHLLLVAVPLSLRIAAGPALGRFEPALLALARQRGLGLSHVTAALFRGSLAITVSRTLFAPTGLALFSVLLTAPDGHSAAKRALVLGGVLGAGALAAIALVSLAFIAGRIVPRAPRFALVLGFSLSALFAMFDATRLASPVGAYFSLLDVIVAHGPE